MSRTKQEIAQELTHQQRLLHVLRERRRALELQVTQQGAAAPAQLLSEIDALTSRIRVHEEEIGRLETLAAEDRLPLAETEYCVLLAEAWNTPQGNPTVADATRLELERLRLGVSPRRAHELERQIRVALAQQSLQALRSIEDLNEPRGVVCLEQAIYLDPATALRWLLVNNSPRLVQRCVGILQKHWMNDSRIWSRPEDRSLFERFMMTLEDALDRRSRAVTRSIRQ
jgi:hypothetical protein